MASELDQLILKAQSRPIQLTAQEIEHRQQFIEDVLLVRGTGIIAQSTITALNLYATGQLSDEELRSIVGDTNAAHSIMHR